MFDNSLINVFIGLAFLFLIYSLFITALQEALATIIKRRSHTLFRGIRSMLTNTPRLPVNKRLNLVSRFFKTFGIRFKLFCFSLLKLFALTDNSAATIQAEIEALEEKMNSAYPEIKLYKRFYQNPIIKSFRQNAYFSKPSYINPQNFSAILVEEIKNMREENRHKTATFQMVQDTLMEFKHKIDAEAVDILKFHLNEAAGDLDVFKSRLENWFNDTMNRVSGWYKRNTHFFLLLLGLGVVIIMNVDTIEIVNYLSKNKQAAEKLAEMGVAAAGNPRYSGGSDSLIANEVMDSLKADLYRTNTLLGLGWADYGASDSLFMERCLRHRPALSRAHRQLKDTAERLFLGNITAVQNQSNMSASQKQEKIDFFNRKHDSLVRQYQFKMLYENNQFAPRLQIAYVWSRTTNPTKLLGFFITTIAIGLGAPFWFDLLNRLTNFRTAGKITPASSPGTKNRETQTEIDG